MSFWQSLPKPIIGLSPMDGVTDHPFRHITKKYGQPALIYTEFTSVEGVCHGAQRLLEDFLFDETQRPVIAQIYGFTPEHFRQTAILLCELGFDGIDINMGCPAKNVAHSGAGAALILTPDLATQIITATKQGVQDYLNGQRSSDCQLIIPAIAQEVARRHQLLPAIYQPALTPTPRLIPVSVKTRVGYDQKNILDWIKVLLESTPTAIALHGRTLKQHYSGQADWDEIALGAELAHQTQTLLLGNGDVTSQADALTKVAQYGVDGVLIGRASFGNPFVFQPTAVAERNIQDKDLLFSIAVEHAQLYQDTYQHLEKYSFMPMRKHLGWYVRGVPNASDFRLELFQANSVQDVKNVFQKYAAATEKDHSSQPGN